MLATFMITSFSEIKKSNLDSASAMELPCSSFYSCHLDASEGAMTLSNLNCLICAHNASVWVAFHAKNDTLQSAALLFDTS